MKKVFSLIIILSLLLGIVPAFSETEAGEVDINLASGDITINGTYIDNSKEAYPFVSYKDITYFPMTWDFAKSMGLSTEWTPETGLKINKSGSGEAVKLSPTANNDLTKSYKASVSGSKIEVEGNSIDNASEEFPVLTFRDITYFPMTWRFMVEEFGADYSWNAATGLNITSSAKMNTEAVVEVEEAKPIEQVKIDVTTLSDENRPVVTIEMEDGQKIILKLVPEIAPNTVNSYISLINSNYYDGLIFHRVIKGFMIQGGDPTGRGSGGPGYTIKDEHLLFDEEANTVTYLPHDRGVLSMAKTQAPDSAGSQFFIMHQDGHFLNGQYTAFGFVAEGMDVIDALATVETLSGDRPVEDVVIKTITVKLNGFEFTEPETIQ